MAILLPFLFFYGKKGGLVSTKVYICTHKINRNALYNTDNSVNTPNWENELEELSNRMQEPVNLNVATREQLEQFPFLSDIQIEHLLAYIYIHGQMKTIYELS